MPQHYQQTTVPGALPQYGQPVFAQTPIPQAKLNVFGVTSLALLAFAALLNVLTPILYRFDDPMLLSSISTACNTIIHVAAAVLALVGVLKKNAP